MISLFFRLCQKHFALMFRYSFQLLTEEDLAALEYAFE